MDGDHLNEIEKVVRRLNEQPMANKCKDIIGMSSDEIWEIFLDEHKAFQKKLPLFHQPHKWNSQDAVKGRTWLWHKNIHCVSPRFWGMLLVESLLNVWALDLVNRVGGMGMSNQC
jgi:hypothetical protein